MVASIGKKAVAVATIISIMLYLGLSFLFIRSHHAIDCIGWRGTSYDTPKLYLWQFWMEPNATGISVNLEKSVETGLDSHAVGVRCEDFRGCYYTANSRAFSAPETATWTERVRFGHNSWTATFPGHHGQQEQFIVPWWAMFLLTALLPAWDIWTIGRRWSRTKRGLCPGCGYDIRACAERCPECGQKLPFKFTQASDALENS